MGAWLAGWIEAERGRFMLFLPVAMGAAILVYFDLPTEPPLWAGPAACLAALSLLAACRRFPPAQFAALLLLAAALGFARAEWRTAAEPALMNVPYGAVTIAGRVAGVEVLPLGRRITVAAAAMNGAPTAPRTIRMRLRNDDDTALNAGDQVALRAMLFRQDRPAYPGGWDYGRDAFFQGLGASGFALGSVTVTTAAPPGKLSVWVSNLRNRISARILAVLPVRTGSVAVTLLTGFQQTMPAAERQAFIAAGLAHLLAVAGLHVGIVMGLFFAAARFGLARFEPSALHADGKALAALIALAAGAGYAVLTGAHLPILRSLAMASLVTAGVLVGRRAVSLRGLALAAMLIMLMTPEAVTGVSFQMSFSAVLALIAGYAAVQTGFARLHGNRSASGRLVTHIAALAYTSLLAGGASMPFAAYQFQQIQPYWILANLVAVPLTALWVMPLGLLALALMPFGLAAMALLPMGWGISVIVWMTERIATWPGAMLRVEPMPDLAILLFAFGLAWLGLWRSRPRLAGLAFMAAAGAVYLAARPPDLLVSPDARLIAVHAAPRVLLFRQPKASSYTAVQWLPVWGGIPLEAVDHTAPPPGLACSAAGCLLTAAHGRIMVAFGPQDAGCGGAVLVASPEPLHDKCDAPGRIVIDRFSVWRAGAIAAWIGPHGVSLSSDRLAQGNRPWVAPWPSWQKGD